VDPERNARDRLRSGIAARVALFEEVSPLHQQSRLLDTRALKFSIPRVSVASARYLPAENALEPATSPLPLVFRLQFRYILCHIHFFSFLDFLTDAA